MVVANSKPMTINSVVDEAIEIWKEAIQMRVQGELDKDQIQEWRFGKLRALLDKASETLPRTQVGEALREVANTFGKL